jgi:hypothetical protein
MGYVGSTLDVILVGSRFMSYTIVDMGDDIAVNSQDTLSTSDSFLVNITIDGGATPGVRDVIVVSVFEPDTLTGGFEVLATPRHFVSLAGGGTYPYASPSEATHSIEDAIQAASSGDSILIEGATYSLSSLHIDKGVALMGAWNSGFTERDVDSTRTVLTLAGTGNVLISSGANASTIDGFVVENGAGTFGGHDSGQWGGGVKVWESTATIRNCEIRNCDASGGGGIYAFNSVLSVEDSHIHSNTATFGGGLYLYDSGGSATNTAIVGNDVTRLSGLTEGGGVYMEACTTVVFTNNTIDGNIGATNGGGMVARSSAGVTIDGGSVSGNSASSNGAGLCMFASETDVSKTVFDGNIGLLGGAVAATNSSNVSFRDCVFSWNHSAIGGGVYAANGDADITHNLFVGNEGSSGGGAVYLANLTSGEMIGNTLDRNNAASGAGGMSVNESPVELYNNIVTNSAGIGVQCSGTAPTLGYNDVWNSSSSDYDGCAAGPGSISSDPAFVDTSQCDYHLGAHSPAIDAGRPGTSYQDPDGSRGDMGVYGAHTFTMEQPSYPKDVATNVSAGELTISWDENPEGDVDYYAVYCDTTSGFVPSVGTLVSTTPDTSLTIPAPSDTTYYRISAVDTSGYAGGYSNEAASEGGTASAVGNIARVTNRLDQNAPNPFNPSTTISFAIAAPGRVDLVIYDVAGRRVRSLVGDNFQPDVYRVTWNGINDRGEHVASGIYFYRLSAGAFTQTRKMVLLK